MSVPAGGRDPFVVASTELSVHAPENLPLVPLSVVNPPCRNWLSRILTTPGGTGAGFVVAGAQSARGCALVSSGAVTACVWLIATPAGGVATTWIELPTWSKYTLTKTPSPITEVASGTATFRGSTPLGSRTWVTASQPLARPDGALHTP